MIRASSVIALLLTLCHTACFSALSGPFRPNNIVYPQPPPDVGNATGIMATQNVLSTHLMKNEDNNNNNPRTRTPQISPSPSHSLSLSSLPSSFSPP
jgi:hypothetical protein